MIINVQQTNKYVDAHLSVRRHKVPQDVTEFDKIPPFRVLFLLQPAKLDHQLLDVTLEVLDGLEAVLEIAATDTHANSA